MKSKCKECGEYFEHDTENYGTDECLCSRCITEKEGFETDILIGQMDATIWADEFVKIVKEKPKIAIDKGTMIGWFANAIMTGYEKGRDAGEKLKRNVIATNNVS